MKNFQDLIKDCIDNIGEVFPWELEELMESNHSLLLVDIREPYEFENLHIKDSINVPRGILEPACDYGYDDTVPQLAAARDKDIVVICRSGHRSVLASYTMNLMGYHSVKSLKTGVKGWNDFELPLQNLNGKVADIDDADEILMQKIKPEQMVPLKQKATVTA